MTAVTMTFESLSSSVLKYSERSNDADLLAEIPRLIMLAENDCAVDLRVLGNELVASTALTVGGPTLEKPRYWRRTTSLMVVVPGVGRRELQKRTYEYLRNFWPNQAAVDVPRFYAEYNAKNFLIAPTPQLAYATELIYFARLDPLADDNQVNWFTENAPQLLLYGTMYHASLFLKNFARADVWKGQYKSTLESMKLEDGTRLYDRTTVEG